MNRENPGEKIAEDIEVLTLVNSKKTELKILTFGATVFSLKLWSANKFINVVVGPADPEVYTSEIYHKRGKFFGATIGRTAGRISGGKFQLNGANYSLYTEDGANLHGGKYGFSYRLWTVEEVHYGKDPFVVLGYFSKGGEEGFPGNLRVKVKYTLTEENELKIEYSAETDQTTVVNLTNHTYFNLSGEGSVNDHELKIDAKKILEVDEKTRPTGTFLNIQGTEYDFRRGKMLGNVFLDTSFVLTGKPASERIFLSSQNSEISLNISTNQPAVVVYVPEKLPQDWEYSSNINESRAAICLEAQVHPDAPNHPEFPSVVLEPGENYLNSTTWKFTTVP